MNDLRELYQAVILDHNRSPRNYCVLDEYNRDAMGVNPLCGDDVHIYLYVNEHGIIEQVSFQGRGCAISTASASIMTETLRGRSEGEAEAYFAAFHQLVMGDGDSASADLDFSKLEVLSGVAEYPARVKCATLAWHTVKAALRETGDKITTE
ncbi:MAG: SUF system NifU family Fe-S cluster assembly protein [Pseudomonadota bacterium]|nr:SUF system NifU family Fe-S cluster assembly protein [Pseudomonadota bacterium]